MGCDQGHQDDEVVAVGGPVNLIGQNVGMTDAGATFPADGVIRLAFDRMLLPITATRQSVTLSDKMGNYATPFVDYDPVARVVSLSNPTGPDAGGCWLLGNQFYSLTLPVPKGDSDSGGLRAIDRATLAQPITIGFQTSANPCAVPPVVTPPADFCADVFPIFQARCSLSQCHGSPMMITVASPLFPENGDAGGLSAPAAGLILDNPIPFRQTAIGRPSQGANTGASTTPGEPGHIFGLNMPIVDPGGNPANSWLIYKLLLATPSPADDPGLDFTCGSASTIAPFNPGPSAHAMSTGERAVLANYVLGREMPYPSFPGSEIPLRTRRTAATTPCRSMSWRGCGRG